MAAALLLGAEERKGRRGRKMVGRLRSSWHVTAFDAQPLAFCLQRGSSTRADQMRKARRLEGVKEDRSDLPHDGLFQRRRVIGQTVE